MLWGMLVARGQGETLSQGAKAGAPVMSPAARKSPWRLTERTRARRKEVGAPWFIGGVRSHGWIGSPRPVHGGVVEW